MPGHDGSRNDVNPADLLSAFDSEEPDPAVDRQEPDTAFEREELDTDFDLEEPDTAVARQEPDTAFERQELDTDFDLEELDTAVDRQEPDTAFERQELDTDFDLQESDTAVARQEPDTAFERQELDTDFDLQESDIAVDRQELNITFDLQESDTAVARQEPDIAIARQELDITFDRPEPDVQPHAPVAPVHGRFAPPPVMGKSVSAVHGDARRNEKAKRNIVIALLVLGGIGLAWSGRVLLRTPGDTGALATPTQDSPQPTPEVLQAAPNVSTPAPDPQSPARTAAPAVSAEPSEDLAATAPVAPPVAPPVERTARQGAPRPVVVDPNAPGGLFAITRPVGAQVFLDDKLVGTTPLFMSRLSAGSHQVRLELPGFKAYSSTIRIEPNERFRLAQQLEELTR